MWFCWFDFCKFCYFSASDYKVCLLHLSKNLVLTEYFYCRILFIQLNFLFISLWKELAINKLNKVMTCSFYRCISGLLKDKICVLVTHQLQYLKDGTSILCLQEVCIENKTKRKELAGQTRIFKNAYLAFLWISSFFSFKFHKKNRFHLECNWSQNICLEKKMYFF